jgi:hypothetical protein
MLAYLYMRLGVQQAGQLGAAAALRAAGESRRFKCSKLWSMLALLFMQFGGQQAGQLGAAAALGTAGELII